MKVITVLISVGCLLPLIALGSPYWTSDTPNYVHGYTKSDGTYVQPYYRANRGSRENNAGSALSGGFSQSYNNRSNNAYGQRADNNEFGGNKYRR